MMEIKHETPSGTRYVVRKQGETKNGSLHHSCHVVLFGKPWTASAATYSKQRQSRSAMVG